MVWRNSGKPFGLRHRVDGPAVIHDDGSYTWYYYGEIHRIGGPAVYRSGAERYEYHVMGDLHRTDGPAVYYGINDHEEWYQFDERHRVDGPAYSYPHKIAWYQQGFRHRIDGPATLIDGHREEWLIQDELHRIGGPACTSQGEFHDVATDRFHIYGNHVSPRQYYDDPICTAGMPVAEIVEMKLKYS